MTRRETNISPFLFMCWQAEDSALRALPAKEYLEWLEFYKTTIPPYHKAGVCHYFIQTCWY